jgi:hypothetical protein
MKSMRGIEPDETRETDQLIAEIEKVLEKQPIHIVMMALFALLGKGIANAARETNKPYVTMCDELATALKEVLAVDAAEFKRRVQ